MSEELREQLAALSHEQWAGWMRYMLSDCASDVCRAVAGPNGEIPKPKIDHPEYRERWVRQMNTPYAELPETEKESDRKEADRMLAIMEKA